MKIQISISNSRGSRRLIKLLHPEAYYHLYYQHYRWLRFRFAVKLKIDKSAQMQNMEKIWAIWIGKFIFRISKNDINEESYHIWFFFHNWADQTRERLINSSVSFLDFKSSVFFIFSFFALIFYLLNWILSVLEKTCFLFNSQK